MIVALFAWGSAESPPTDVAPAASFAVTSATFTDGATLADAAVYQGLDCTGGNKSPALAWSGAPEGTKSYAVIAHDPDAPRDGGWTHWVLFDLPASTRELPEDAGNLSRATLPERATHGTTDFGERAYGGPCPPPGTPHHYRFTVYALDTTTLGLAGNATKADVERKMGGHVLAEATITGLYGR